MRRIGTLASLLLLVAFAGEGAASVRYAEPSGDGPEPCLHSDPCDLEVAAETGAITDGDEVVVLPGTYVVPYPGLHVERAIHIHGATGEPRPKIAGSNVAAGGFPAAGQQPRVSNLEVEGLSLSDAGADRILSHGQCFLVWDAVLTDSACRGVHSGNATVVPSDVHLRNVTSVNPASDGFGISVAGGVTHARVTGKNVIAEGGDSDLVAFEHLSGPQAAVIDLTHSNFETVGGNGTLPTPGLGSNQTAEPLFADATTRDFHQLAGSPTIDAGTDDALNGPLDLDGNLRVAGAAPDIGAYESGSTPPPPPPPDPAPEPDPPPGGSSGVAWDLRPPETVLTKQPPRRTKRRRASFVFGASEPFSRFECRLDRAEFAPCTPPIRMRVHRGRHTFRARAIDLWGNVDPRPAKRTWRVRRR